MGRYRLHVRGEIDPAKQYLVQLEYTWNRQVIRKGMNIFVRLGDWNEKANKGRGGVRASYGPEANRINSLLLARVDKIDSLLAEFQQKHPNQITEQVISDLLADKRSHGRTKERILSSLFRKGLNPIIRETESDAAAMRTARAA